MLIRLELETTIRMTSHERHFISNHRQLFIQQLIQAITKAKSKLYVIGPLWGESTGPWPVISAHK